MKAGWPKLIKSDVHGWLEGDVLEAYDLSRQSSFLCDGRLESKDGQSFDIHCLLCAAASPYFENLFDSVRDENTEASGSASFRLDVDCSILRKILDWIYQAKVSVDDPMLLLELAKSARYLKIVGLNEACIIAFKEAMNPQDLFELWSYAFIHQLEDVTEFCKEYTCRNFTSIYNDSPNKIMEMDASMLHELLDRDFLDVPKEDLVWEVISSWISFDPSGGRSSHLADLLSVIRLGLLTKDTFEDIRSYVCNFMDPCQLESAEQVTLVKEFLDEREKCTLGEYGEGGNWLKPRIPRQLVFVLMANSGPGRRSCLLSYDIRADLWKEVPLIPPASSVAMCQVILGTNELVTVARDPFDAPRVYAVNLESLSIRELSTMNMTPATGCPMILKHWGDLTACVPDGCVEVYSIENNSWKTKCLVGPRGRPNDFLIGAAFVSLKGKLYVVGGMNESLSETTREIRLYNETKELFEVKGEMFQGRVYASCCVWNDKLVVAGGFAQPFSGSLQTVEEFDPCTGIVRSLPHMDIRTNDMCLLPVDDGLLAIEGHRLADARMVAWTSSEKVMQFFDPSVDKWIKLSPFTSKADNDNWMVLGISAVETRKLNNASVFLCDDRRKCVLRKMSDLERLCEEVSPNDEHSDEYSDAIVIGHLF